MDREQREDAAWGNPGRSSETRRSETRQSTCSSLPRGQTRTVELTGYLPDMEKFGWALVALFVAAIGFIIYTRVAAPEWYNIMNAVQCQSDCVLSKLFVGVIMLTSILATLCGLCATGVFVIMGIGFNRNTIKVDVKGL